MDGHERMAEDQSRRCFALRGGGEERKEDGFPITSVDRLLTSTSVTIFTEVSAVMMPSRAPSQKEEEAVLNIAGSFLILPVPSLPF
jgi:hypothetical protein